jgi:hypothetical protein
MDLYYKLENKNHLKIKKKLDAKPNSIMALFKHINVVRGNSWKSFDSEVQPMYNVGLSHYLDMNMFKNPDLFDTIHNNFNSQF